MLYSSSSGRAHSLSRVTQYCVLVIGIHEKSNRALGTSPSARPVLSPETGWNVDEAVYPNDSTQYCYNRQTESDHAKDMLTGWRLLGYGWCTSASNEAKPRGFRGCVL